MATLTRKQRAALEAVLGHAKRASEYVFSPRIAIAHRGKQSTTTLDYVRQSDGTILYEVEKAYGSNLTGLPEAIRRLEGFLASD